MLRNQIAELDADFQGPSQSGSGVEERTVKLWQDLNTDLEQSYQLSFWARRRHGSHGAQLLTVKWGGEALMSDVNMPSEWTQYSFEVSASSETTRLEFLDTGTPNSFGVFLDDVQVTYETEPVVAKNSHVAFQIKLANVLGTIPCSDKIKNKKVLVCHIPPGNPKNAHTISISENAVSAHLAHGDTLGECEDSTLWCEEIKSTICHIPHDHPEDYHEIEVSDLDKAIHLAHGDYEGSCVQPNLPPELEPLENQLMLLS